MVEFDISDLHITLFSNSGFHEDRVSKSHTLLLKAVNDITATITKFLGRFRWYSVLGILEFYQQILIKFPSIKFYEYPPSWYTRTDMMELICVFQNFANAAKIWYQLRKKISEQIFSMCRTHADWLHWANFVFGCSSIQTLVTYDIMYTTEPLMQQVWGLRLLDLYDKSPGYITQYRGVLYLAHQI